MDYTVWSETMALRLLADCLAAEIGDAAVLRTVALEKIAALGRKQNGSGGFSYFLTTDLDAATAPPVAAMTFTTAAVLLSLLRAKSDCRSTSCWSKTLWMFWTVLADRMVRLPTQSITSLARQPSQALPDAVPFASWHACAVDGARLVTFGEDWRCSRSTAPSSAENSANR